ncbi:hypothetical protein D9756_003880 [Leucocoprinus leucothites]|uniref:Cupredoxin n=1 Tax=Leucocoprinus leucothites TaxID=201217 RepID=A0A8H5G0Y3_9AGAR|nr:hypothetical protein D9756_003880 [Leucoagaricus leucothites]
MFASSLSLGLALLPFVSAAVHDIQVGANGKLEFSPENIAAQPGDQVVFHFVSKNHTVTQSSFPDPCGPKDGGFDSGFMPVAANQTDNFPTHTITVQDSQPIWVYCRQKQPLSHCGAGMVFAVNCGLDGAPNSFTNFKQAALAVGAAQASATPAATPDPYTTAPATPDASVTAPTTPDASVTAPADSTPTAAQGQVHVVKVGGSGSLAFDPAHLQAQPNDIVVFQFQEKNHTVTQSSFADPCRRLNANGTLGFDSDFHAVTDTGATLPTWNYTVTGTAPVWAYCRQTNPANHCGAGMVFAINSVETSEKNFTAFQNIARAMNGTGASANSPSSATSLRLGGATVTIVFTAALALLL